MGNIVYKMGRKVYWDVKRGEFKKDLVVNKLILVNYYNGWKVFV